MSLDFNKRVTTVLKPTDVYMYTWGLFVFEIMQNQYMHAIPGLIRIM